MSPNAVEAALLPCGGQLIAKVNEVDTLFSPGELILLAWLHQHTSLHFLFKIEIFFHTTFFSPHGRCNLCTNWKHQPFHKVQNHEQDLNIYRQIMKILLRQMHQHNLFYFIFKIEVFFHYMERKFQTFVLSVKWLDFSICPIHAIWSYIEWH